MDKRGSRHVGILCLSLLMAGSLHVNAQKVSFNEGKISLEKAFRRIEASSDYKIAYNKTLLDTNKIVELNQKEEEVTEILNQILVGTGCTFTVKGKYIVISPLDRKPAEGRNKKLTGMVLDERGEPIIGANVAVVGTRQGTITDLDGNFSIDAPENGRLEISYIGYLTQTININNDNDNQLRITLHEDTQKLDEVVVTALGMKRAEKALGYSVTELKADELRANTINPVAALQGKVAGVEIAGSDGGMFGSTKIQVRGASTLGANNQPIYVVDGIILDNNISSSGDADWAANADDYGNELKNLNPDDFESVSVLKGAAATALYGSRGLNGAVVITTKSGKKGQGLGISVSQTFGVDHVYKQPDLQNLYGDGSLAGSIDYGDRNSAGDFYRFDTNQFMTNSSGGHSLYGGGQGLSFGPRFDGSEIENYDHTMTAYRPSENNYKDAYNLGFNSNTNVAVQGGNDKTTFYTSLSYKYASGTLPNNSFERIAMMAKASHNITDKVKLEASLAFANSMPKNAQRSLGTFFFDGTFSRAYNPDYFRHKYLGAHGGLANNDYGDTYGNVPGRGFWMSLYNDNFTQKETNIRPTLSLNIDLTDWLIFKTEGNYNYFYKRSELKELGQGYNNEGGKYEMRQYGKEQTNLNATFTANKQLGDWNIGGFLRGELFDHYVQSMSMSTDGGLIVPDQYFINNSKNQPKYDPKIEARKRMMSMAFQVGANWRNQIFIDVTGRNDWSSALVYANKTGNYSYFYPSVSGSWLLNETFELPDWISLGKIRASWAQVGNDTDAFTINQAYALNTTRFPDGYIYGLQISDIALSKDLKPERKNAWEVGLDWRFLQSRINVDATYYKENTKNQIMTIDIPYVSGVKQQLINAGNIQNSGVEIALNTVPIRSKDWEWTLDFTWTKNINKIVSLHENVADYIRLTGNADYGNYRIASVAKVGSAYGLLMTDSKALIDEKTGKEVLSWNDNDRYAWAQRSGKMEEIGSLTPDFLGSMATGLSWKNLSMRVAFDMRFGGYIASYGSRYGTSYGYTEASLKYRDPEHGGISWTSKFDNKTYSDGVIPDGIFADGTEVTMPSGAKVDVGGMTFEEAYNKGYVEPVHASQWTYRRNSWGQGVVNDDWCKELNYIALREISLAYRMPQHIASKMKAKNLTFILTGRNLGYLYNTMPNHENPESVRGTSATEFRVRSFAAHTASYVFTVNIGF